MSHRAQKPMLVHPLLSTRSTGMGVAAAGIARMLVPEIADPAPRLDRLFLWINDRAPGGVLRMALRLVVAQIVPLVLPGRRLVFTSHHAPLWRTHRHAVIVYDVIALKHPEQARTQALFYRRILPRVIRCAERLVTISEEARRDLKEVFSHDIARPIEVIPTTSHRLAAVPQLGMSLDDRRRGGILAFIGARYTHKNLGLALQALRAWSETGANARPRLVVTSCRRELWPDLASLEREGAVSVIEYASDREIDELLARAAALIFVSLDEGQGLPPLEAMAVGCPVICSDIPVLRETCGEAARFVDPHQPHALLTLLREMLSGRLDDEVERRRVAGLERVASFHPTVIRARWLRFLSGWL